MGNGWGDKGLAVRPLIFYWGTDYLRQRLAIFSSNQSKSKSWNIFTLKIVAGIKATEGNDWIGKYKDYGAVFFKKDNCGKE